MGKLSAEERPKMGALANEVRERIAAAITAKNEQLEQEEMNKKLSRQTIDVTLPGSQVNIGGRHPLTVVIEEIEDLFIGMGYTVEEGPEVETDYYNFEALNLPKEHPARDMQDSFYITEEMLMRTQTSPQCRRARWKSIKEKAPSKSFVPVKCIAATTMTRHIPISSCRSKVSSWTAKSA